MKVVFLGTSHGKPELNRHCSCFMIETDKGTYIIDMGAPVSDLFINRNKNFEDVKAIFISHFHLDHSVGSQHFIDLCSWYYKNTSFSYYAPEQKALDSIKAFEEAAGVTIPEDRIKMQPYGDGFVYDDGVLHLEAIRTEHTSYNPVISSYAFYVRVEGKELLFTNDLSMNLSKDDFPKIAFEKHFDLIVTECAHFEVDVLEKYISKLDTDKLAVTHIFPLRKYDELENIKNKYNYTFLLPKDNDEIVF